MTANTTDSGEAMFARYAYPPGQRDLGERPDPSASSQSAADTAERPPVPGSDPLDARSRPLMFDGAWPYLEHLARMAGAASMMDPYVVEAYWVGNDLLEATDPTDFAELVMRSFAGHSGADWGALAGEHTARPVPHHSFHVFAIYPWVNILRLTGAAGALELLDRCRIRWGRVESIGNGTVVVQCQPLTWTGSVLRLGASRPEGAKLATGGQPLHPGQWVSLHWDWVCDLLSATQLTALSDFTVRQLAITNRPR